MWEKKDDRLVVVEPCGSYDEKEVWHSLSRVLEPLGGLAWVQEGMTIVIKANLVTFAKPEEAATTHPALLCALVKMLKDRGARVIVGDSPGGLYNSAYVGRIYRATGMERVREAGAELNEDFGQASAQAPQARVLHDFVYTSYLDRADAIIDFCKLKTHGMMGMSAAAKNMFGVIPGTVKPEYHFRFPNPTDFARMIVDLDEYFAPRLCIADAVVGMEGNGPTQGTPRKIGALVASCSPHALDLVCAHLIGLAPENVPTLLAARERDLIPADWHELPVAGDVEALVIPDYGNIAVRSSLVFDHRSKFFGWLARRNLESRPAVSLPDCRGCGKCAQICPAQAIAMVKGKPRIQRKTCIRCFCCQEFCPFGAMEVHRPLVARMLNR